MILQFIIKDFKKTKVLKNKETDPFITWNYCFGSILSKDFLHEL
jgi:hypothetical protein